ncbi:hypothetical protein QUB70_01240 [Microcoleus sp. A003_D6]|uniref:hypothetical protein n=1 Tax=Microcoleus sp. A003_D6 TaxID=3055266 RepID=UPI002FD1E021
MAFVALGFFADREGTRKAGRIADRTKWIQARSKVEGTRGTPTTPFSHKRTKALATSHLDFSF